MLSLPSVRGHSTASVSLGTTSRTRGTVPPHGRHHVDRLPGGHRAKRHAARVTANSAPWRPIRRRVRTLFSYVRLPPSANYCSAELIEPPSGVAQPRSACVIVRSFWSVVTALFQP